MTSRAIPAPVYRWSRRRGASARLGRARRRRLPTNQAAIDAAKLDRVYIAVFLSMASPDYLIQK